MGNVQSYVVVSLTVCPVYLAFVYIYRSHTLLKTPVLSNDRLPSLLYLYIKYLTKALTRTAGCLYTASPRKVEVIYTVLNCRLETPLLRKFCSVAGYGWDYPDTEYRDIPLCFPEFLCGRLLLMVLTDGDFRLSPAGLVRVRQSLKTLQPIDELKKGPFMLQVRVLAYRQTDAGVEVDLCMSATSRAGCPVWESVLTLLSKNKLHSDSRCLPTEENQPLLDEGVSENSRQVELRVPRTNGLQCVWSPSDFSPLRLFGYRTQTSLSLWLLSVCLAEIEKHKGVGVITAPVDVTAQFKEPLLAPGRAMIKFWETTNGSQSSARGSSFHVQQQGSNISHVTGQIFRS